MPEGESWHVWRVVTSTRFACTLHDLQTRYDLDDLVRFHAVLDTLESTDHQLRQKQKASRP